jgi:hypothetical protein
MLHTESRPDSPASKLNALPTVIPPNLLANHEITRWVAQLPQTLEESGFADPNQAPYQPAPVWYHAWTTTQLAVCEEVSWGVPDPQGARIRENALRAAGEAHTSSMGAVTKQAPVVTIARLV